MHSKMNEIKKLLKNYYFYKATISDCGMESNPLKDKMFAIDSVLNKLDSADKSLIELYYFKKNSAEDTAKLLHIGYATVYRRLNTIIKEILYCYSDKFK